MMCEVSQKIYPHTPWGDTEYDRPVRCHYHDDVDAVQFEARLPQHGVIVRGWVCPECATYLGSANSKRYGDNAGV